MLDAKSLSPGTLDPTTCFCPCNSQNRLILAEHISSDSYLPLTGYFKALLSKVEPVIQVDPFNVHISLQYNLQMILSHAFSILHHLTDDYSLMGED